MIKPEYVIMIPKSKSIGLLFLLLSFGCKDVSNYRTSGDAPETLPHNIEPSNIQMVEGDTPTSAEMRLAANAPSPKSSLAPNGYISSRWSFDGISPDGRLRIRCQPINNDGSDTSYCGTRVFRPLKIGVDHRGYPDFKGDGSFPIWSPEVLFNGTNGQQYSADKDDMHLHTFMASDPLFTGPSNPYRCNADGVTNNLGSHDCYHIIVFNARIPKGNFAKRYMKAATARVRVKSFQPGSNTRIEEPTVSYSQFNRPWLNMGTGGKSYRPINNWEPSSTPDGRLTFFAFGEYSYNASESTDWNTFMKSWTTPKNVSLLHTETITINGMKFKDRYPIARQPFKNAAGFNCAPNCGGSYNWISRDATELFFTRGVIPNQNGVGVTSKTNLFVMGVRTNFTEKYVDAWTNLNRHVPVAFVTSPGLSQGMWGRFTELEENSSYPYKKNTPVYPIFASTGYSEITFDDNLDRDYAVYLPMNELALGTKQKQDDEREYMLDNFRWFSQGHKYIEINENKINRHRTPDTSGNFNTAALVNASFPTEYWINRGIPNSENIGVFGRGIYVGDNGYVKVATTTQENINPNSKNVTSFNKPLNCFTVEIGVKPLADLPEKGEYNLVKKAGSWSIISKAGLLAIRFSLKDGAEKEILTDSRLHKNGSYRIGIVGRSLLQEFHIYLNGSLVKTEFVDWYKEIVSNSSDILIGPAQSSSSSAATLIIDEFTYSHIPRDSIYFRERSGIMWESAGLKKPKDIDGAWPASLEPPLGLLKKNMFIPDSVASLIEINKFDEGVSLGEKLFHDKDLTGNDVSCNTCHDSSKDFIDPRTGATSDGVAGKPKTLRNSQTLWNRAFSTAQFFDGRANNLFDQIKHPLLSSNEMGGIEADILAYLNKPENGYTSLFQNIYGEPASLDNISTSIASFLLTQMTGNTIIDRMNAGSLTNTESSDPEVASLRKGRAIFLGKGRCVSCHNGGIFSDERFHNTATSSSADRGRIGSTGLSKDDGRFKTPSLRRVNATAPYMHDGRFTTLHQVVTFYNSGAFNHANLDPEMQILGLSSNEVTDLTNYLSKL
jgi:cytochrome c peroxidase